MKRFYCTTCKTLKRVHRLPENVIHDGQLRVGECRWHGAPSHRTALLADRRPKARVTVTRKAAPVLPPQRPKKKSRTRIAEESVA